MLLEAMASDSGGGGGCFSSSSSESNSSNLICSRILKGSRLGPAKSKKIRPWRHARGFAQMPSTFQPLNQTPKTHPETHGHPALVQRVGSVLGFCAWFTDTADCDRQSACGWLMLTLVQKSRCANAALWFFSAIWLIHTLTSTRILPPPLALESLSSIFISLFSSA